MERYTLIMITVFDLSFGIMNHYNNRRKDICEPIQIPMCQHMKYNMTRMPNLLHHSSQENAKLQIEQFTELVDQKCSDVLLFYLCAMYAPICTVNFQSEPIPPCRSVCEEARAGCEHILNEHNISWPEYLDCSSLPRYDRGVCVRPAAIVPSLGNKDKSKLDSRGPNNKITDFDLSKESYYEDCRCNRKSKLKRKAYRKGKYHFSIRGVVKGQAIANTINTVTRVTVVKVYRSTRVHIQEGSSIELWTNSTCVCPELTKRKEYLIVGYEDLSTQRLLFLDSCLSVKWKNKLDRRIKNWEKKIARSKRNQKCRRKKGKRCRKNRKNKSKRNKTKENRRNKMIRDNSLSANKNP
ncbi:secreted frizzled-related protein 3-like [Mytilus edulis]|uniref:secreted frizzled-related protein 3-like n=1 Tax=Mytilus edulis TaxID=6550 RepID=UPI0039F03680